MDTGKRPDISFFERNLTWWVALCMAAAVLIGKFLPRIPEFPGRFEYAQVSIPIAVCINNATIIGLLQTLVLIFSFQGEVILNNPLHIVLKDHDGKPCF